jgi:hypothetical protein
MDTLHSVAHHPSSHLASARRDQAEHIAGVMQPVAESNSEVD